MLIVSSLRWYIWFSEAHKWASSALDAPLEIDQVWLNPLVIDIANPLMKQVIVSLETSFLFLALTALSLGKMLDAFPVDFVCFQQILDLRLEEFGQMLVEGGKICPNAFLKHKFVQIFSIPRLICILEPGLVKESLFAKHPQNRVTVRVTFYQALDPSKMLFSCRSLSYVSPPSLFDLLYFILVHLKTVWDGDISRANLKLFYRFFTDEVWQANSWLVGLLLFVSDEVKLQASRVKVQVIYLSCIFAPWVSVQILWGVGVGCYQIRIGIWVLTHYSLHWIWRLRWAIWALRHVGTSASNRHHRAIYQVLTIIYFNKVWDGKKHKTILSLR